MKRLDPDSILNSSNEFFANTSSPVLRESQLSYVVYKNIVQGRKPIKPPSYQQYCQYPSPPRIDDFDLREGIGKISLRPTIDALNMYKQMAIEVIKTKFQSMGPENTKDAKLASGAIDVIQQVYNAAKCFTQTVTNVNNLIDTYINAVESVIYMVINQINLLTNQVNYIKYMLNPTHLAAELVTLLGDESLKLLEAYTGVFELLGVVSQLENQLNIAQMEVSYLVNRPERALLRFEADLMYLKNSLNRLAYALELKSLLENNIAGARNLKMTNNYMEDFNYVPYTESSYNWSVTNSAGLTNYNIADPDDVLGRLTKFCHTYDGKKRFIIDSRSESGKIVVPQDGDGLISAGLDPRCGASVAICLELSINDGETIIQAVAYGKPATGDTGTESIVSPVVGRYVYRGVDKFSYSHTNTTDNTSFELFVTDTNMLENVSNGTTYQFINPLTERPWYVSWKRNSVTNTDDPTPLHAIVKAPILFKVISKSHNSVTVKVLQDVTISQFLNVDPGDYSTATYEHTTPPLSATGDFVVYTSTVFDGSLDGDGNQNYKYYLVDSENASILDSNGEPTYIIASSDAAALAQLTTGQKLSSITLNTIALTKFNLGDSNSIYPHTGEQIPCRNWTLYAYPDGNLIKARELTFKRGKLADDLNLIFLKAHFGFIPDEG